MIFMAVARLADCYCCLSHRLPLPITVW